MKKVARRARHRFDYMCVEKGVFKSEAYRDIAMNAGYDLNNGTTYNHLAYVMREWQGMTEMKLRTFKSIADYFRLSLDELYDVWESEKKI